MRVARAVAWKMRGFHRSLPQQNELRNDEDGDAGLLCSRWLQKCEEERN